MKEGYSQQTLHLKLLQDENFALVVARILQSQGEVIEWLFEH